MERQTLAVLACFFLPGCFSPPEPGTTGEGSAAGTSSAGESGSEDSSSTTGGTDASSGAAAESSSGAGLDASTGEDDEDIEFVDSFEADAGQWRFEDDAGAVEEGPSNWFYSGGDLVQDSDISGAETDNPSLGTYALGGDLDWDAYLVEVDYTADDDGVAGVLCHLTEGGDFIRFDLDHETGIVRLIEKRDGQLSVLEEVEVFATPMTLEVQRRLTLECGDTYRGFVDGALVIEGGESLDAEGGVGLYASSIGDGPAGLRFHSIAVSDD